MTRVPRRHGDRHGESKDTSTKFSNNRCLYTGSGGVLVGLYSVSKNEKKKEKKEKEKKEKNKKKGGKKGIESKIR